MPKTLILIRHAKSSWDTPGMEDFDRPLNERGQRSAEAIGSWLRDEGWTPDQAISSAATRTKQTFARLGLDIPVDYTRDLYRATGNQILRVLHRAEGDTVLLLGHNPGIGEFASAIVEAAPAHVRFGDFPTCATLVVRFHIDSWEKLVWHSGKVLDFVIPRDLLEE